MCKYKRYLISILWIFSAIFLVKINSLSMCTLRFFAIFTFWISLIFIFLNFSIKSLYLPIIRITDIKNICYQFIGIERINYSVMRNIVWRKGSSLEPCGIPKDFCKISDLRSLINTLWVLLDKYSWKNVRKFCSVPMCSGIARSRGWFSVSNVIQEHQYRQLAFGGGFNNLISGIQEYYRVAVARAKSTFVVQITSQLIIHFFLMRF